MVTAPSIERDWRKDFALIAIPALAMFVVGLNPGNLAMFMDGDTNWHVATGQWILAHGYVPTTDPFSFTAAGKPWVTHEWLSEVLMAIAYSVFGWVGVTILASIAVALVMAMLGAELRRWLGRLSVIAALGMSIALLRAHYMARPHIIALPLMVFWTIQLLKARRQGRVPSLWLLPVMILWANFHGSFIFGLAFTAFFALEAVVDARFRAKDAFLSARVPHPISSPLKHAVALEYAVIRSPQVASTASGWAAFLTAATLMALITPNGIAGLFHPLHVLSMKNLNAITEWRPENFERLTPLIGATFFTLAVCLHRGVRMAAVRLGLLLLLLYMSFKHVRQEVVLAVMAPLLLAEPLSHALEPSRAAIAPVRLLPPWKTMMPALASVGLLFLATAAIRLGLPEVRTDRVAVPVSALEHVPASLRAKPVFNDYSFGGWLIYHGVRPFMDGRSDMYGDDLLKLYLDVNSADPQTVSKTFRRYDIQWTILAPDSPLVRLLDSRPDWHRTYTDKWAVVQVRDKFPSQPARSVPADKVR